MKQKPIALEAYEALADAYAGRIDTKPHNAYYERPATLSLLPEVRGKRVLDAGCGPGVYAEWLADHGAQVTAVDVSPRMAAHARQRLGSKAEVRVADLNRPLTFLSDGSFDLIISALALDYLEDWRRVFAEFNRILVKNGHLVFSAGHPFGELIRNQSMNYFETQRTVMEWTGFGTKISMPYFYRPLQAMLNPLLESGFVLEKVLEPQPIEQFKAADAEDFEKLNRQPGFLCLRAMKG
jgi:SAM-dependent methyltransferase